MQPSFWFRLYLLQDMSIGELPSGTLEAIMDSQLATRGKVCPPLAEP
jgi:hypothetical protein